MVLQTGFKTFTNLIRTGMISKASGVVRKTAGLNIGSAENFAGDVCSFGQTSKILENIRKLITTHAPLDRQEALLSKYNKYAQEESGLKIIESLMEGISKSEPNVQGETLIKNYNRCFNNLITLQKNNPEEFKLMMDCGFFDLVRQGKIHPDNYNYCFNNIITLRNNNPEEFKLMLDGGFFDLAKQ